LQALADFWNLEKQRFQAMEMRMIDRFHPQVQLLSEPRRVIEIVLSIR
jgi:hypothetical protein